MSDEKILLVSDSLEGPTGFATNGQGVAWSLAKDYDVHVLGLQSGRSNIIKLNIEGEEREVFQHANIPRARQQYDFGFKSLPKLLDEIQPDVLLTINDIQMIEHVPGLLAPNGINLKIMDLPSKKFLSEDAVQMQLEGMINKFKEKYPRDIKWILLGPQDGIPPMQKWAKTYALADQVVAMSKFGQKVYKDYFGINVPFIYHGVDSEVFSPRVVLQELEDNFIVGDINRNQPRKQPIRVIEAFAKFAKDKPDAKLHMQMDWNDRFGWNLNYFTNLYGIQNKCISPKKVGISKNELAEVYSSWDVNMMTTGGEGFGIPFIESGFCGTPNIACDYTTSKELVIDGNPSPRGTLVKHHMFWDKFNVSAVQRSLVDIDDLVKTLNYYYENREVAEQHGMNAREWCLNNVTMKKLEPKWLEVVKNTLNGD